MGHTTLLGKLARHIARNGDIDPDTLVVSGRRAAPAGQIARAADRDLAEGGPYVDPEGVGKNAKNRGVVSSWRERHGV